MSCDMLVYLSLNGKRVFFMNN